MNIFLKWYFFSGFLKNSNSFYENGLRKSSHVLSLSAFILFEILTLMSFISKMRKEFHNLLRLNDNAYLVVRFLYCKVSKNI